MRSRITSSTKTEFPGLMMDKESVFAEARGLRSLAREIREQARRLRAELQKSMAWAQAERARARNLTQWVAYTTSRG